MTEALIEFRRLSKADEEQSMIEDLFGIFDNPPLLAILGLLITALWCLPPSGSSSDVGLKKKSNVESNTTTKYPSKTAVVAILAAFGFFYALDFDVGILPLTASNDTSVSSSMLKPYTDFSSFYQEAYLDAHVIPASRTSHFWLSSTVMAIWIWDTRLGVASIAALLVGALSTIPLSLRSSSQPLLEFSLVLMAGMAVSKLCGYGTSVRWLVFFNAWAFYDYFDHFFLGHNGSTAMYMGQHYISWALIAQLKLAFGIAISWVTGSA